MTDVLMTDQDWRSLRLTHPEVWKQIQTDAQHAELRADLIDQGIGTAVLTGAIADVEAMDEAHQRRAVRLGQRRVLDYFPVERAGLDQIRSKLAAGAYERDARAFDPVPTIPEWAAQGTGTMTSTGMTVFDRGINGIDIARGDSLRKLGCGTYIDNASGRDVIMVTDYTPFPSTTPAHLSAAINPKNWPAAYNDFFKGIDDYGDVSPVSKGSFRAIYKERVRFQLTPAFGMDVETVLRFDLYGDPAQYEQTADPWDLPAMSYRLELGENGEPLGDGKVLVDNGHAVINRLPDGTFEIESLKNIYFDNALLNAVSQYACWVWPRAIKDTVKKGGVEPWPKQPSVASRAGSRTRLTPVGTGTRRRRASAAPEQEQSEAGFTNRADRPTDWLASYADAVANFFGKTAKDQMIFSNRLTERWSGNQEEVTLDQFADDSIEYFELNTELVSDGAKLAVEWMEKLTKSVVPPGKKPDQPSDPATGEGGGSDGSKG